MIPTVPPTARQKESNPVIAWTLPSADSWNSVSITPRPNQLDSERQLGAKVTITGQFWSRSDLETSRTAKDLQPDFLVKLSQVILSKDSIRALVHALEQWLRGQSEFEVDLSGVRNQMLR